jgi:hypothetical protein
MWVKSVFWDFSSDGRNYSVLHADRNSPAERTILICKRGKKISAEHSPASSQ